MGSRRYEAARHARTRLAERYSMALSEQTWTDLARQIEEWPYIVLGNPRIGTEAREATVQLAGPDGTVWVIPVRYVANRNLCKIMTIMPNGFKLARRNRATANP